MFNKKKSTARKAVIDWQQGLQPASEILSLEQRIMLDAAAPATVDAVNDSLNTDTTAADTAADEATLSEALVDNSRRQEIVFVDSSIEGHEDLLADIFAAGEEIYWQPADASNVEFTTVVTDDRVITIFAIDGNEQGFSALTDTLGSKHSIDAIHILSHGTEAGVKMGAETIANDSLGRYADQLSVWGDALNSDGDILLYGCNVGVEGAGVEFVQSFARITNADVAASDDYTGAEQYGGDWQLEVASGSVETELVAGEFAAALFDGVLVKEVPVPTATLSVPAVDFLGESFIFTATFDNTAVDGDSLGDVGVGYAPYLNVFVEPGVTVNSADYLGSAVDLGTRFTWDAANSQWRDSGSTPVTEHPFGPASDFALPADPGVDGTVWYLIELPFGSFTYNQPPAEVAFNATLDRAAGATVGTALAIGAQGGFRFGADPQNNPAGDAPLLQASPAAATITPLLLDISNTVAGAGNNSAGAENEAATGPNDPITWRINVDIAAGETVNNIVITDLVPNDFFYTGNLTVSGAASGTFVNLATVDATTGVANGNQFSVTFDSVTGGTASDDIVITYTGYIPDVDANGAPILTPSNAALQGDAAAGQIVNNVQIDANYDNGSGLAAIPTDSASETVTPKAIAIQKDVTNVIDANATGNSAGDTLEWTLRLQVSDYFSMENFVVTDVFSDGQLLDSGFTPTYRVIENGADSGVSNFAGGNYTLNAIDAGTGLTTLEFRLSDQLGGDGVLDGDAAANAGGDGRTTVEIKFRTVVQENFQFPASLAGDASVDVNDLLSNNVSVSAKVGGTGNAVSDGSGASVQVVGPSQTKEIYAVNGDTEFTNAELTPGSAVTYRITVNLPTADVENLSIVDFLPLPVFDVNAAFTYGGQFSGSDNVPVSGQYGFGPLTNNADFPADYFNGASPSFGVTVTPDSNANTMTFDFNSFDVDNSTGGVIDLLFTVTAVDAAFADGLQLTNQATVSSSNSNNPQPTAMSIQQIELLAPELDITKGIVAVDASSTGSFGTPLPSTGISFNAANSGGAPFSGGTITSAVIGTKPLTSDVVGVDAGDVVRFALVIENTGGEDAFDITIRDALPPGYAYTGNLAVTLGDGTVVDISSINPTDLFTAGGITLPDSVAAGLAAAGRDATTVTNDGSNIILVTYDATLQSSANALETLTSTAEILAFAGLEGGADYTAGSSDPQWRDSADTTLSGTTITKEIASSGIVNADNGLRDAVVGESVQYELVIQVPEGEMPLAEILDNLDPGLVFVSLDSVTPSSGAVTTGTVTPPSAGSTGTLAFDLGTITNANTDNSTAETLTLRYTVRVANDANALNGAKLNSDVKLRWDVDGNGANTNTNDGSVNDSDGSIPNHRVTVLEPELDVTQLITTAPADEGDAIVYQITINHDSLSSASAYDVTFSDVVPAGISVSSITATHSAAGDIGPTGSNILQLSSNTVTTGAGLSFDLLEAESVVITITGTLTNAIAGADVINSATINWSSLDAANTTDGDETNERGGNAAGLGDGSGGYSETATATFSVSNANVTKRVLSSSIVDANNGNLQAVVGEYITYELVVTVPKAGMPVTEIVDTLGPGLAFVSLDSVTQSSGVTTGVVPPPAAGATGALTFDLGTIDNTNSDKNVDDTVTLQYTVRVLDDATNAVNGAALGNQVELRWDANANGNNSDTTDGSVGDSDGTPGNTVTILEPVLEAVKTITTTPADEGDAISYQVVVRHVSGTSSTTAYDITFSDSVPASVSVSGFSVSHSNLGDVSANFELVGNTVQSVSGTSFDLLETETLTVTLNGTVTDINAGETVSNTASVNWTSLDAATVDGDDANERDGSSGYVGTSLAASFTADSVALIKEVVSTGIVTADNANLEASIGEYVNYRIVVTLPEGDAPLAQIVDTLAAGLVFDAANGITVTRSGAGISTDMAGGFASASAAVAGQAITIDLGNISNDNTDNGVAETLTIEYRAYVANDSSAQPAGVFRDDTLGGSVEFRWDADGNAANDDGSAGDSDADPINAITIVEADLEVIKTITTTPADLGDVVAYQIVLRHTGNSNTSAYDVTFSDLVDSGIAVNNISATHSSAGAIGPGATGVIEIAGNNVQTAAGQSFDLLEGETLTITINGTVSSAAAGATIGNTATVNWSSLDSASATDGNEAAERGGNGSGRADGSDAYTDTSAAVEFTVNDATIIKRVINTGLNNAVNNNSGAVIGEYVQYEVVVTVPEGDLPLAEIIDPLEAGLEFVSLDSVTSSNAAQLTTDLAGGFTAVSGPAAGTAGSFTLNLGNVSNSNADNSTAETITILYTARVANNPGTATAGAVLGNTVELRWDTNASGGNTEAGDGNVTDSDGSSANNEVTILEPALTVVKSVNEDEPFLGETITYTVTVTNQNAANGSDAFDLNLTDTLPTGMTLDVASIRVDGLASGANANVLTDSSSGNDVNLVLRQLAFDSAITLTYAATVSAAPADFGATLDSNATVNWSSLDAGNSGDGDESAERGGDAAGVSDGSDGYTANDGEAVTLTAYNLAITTDDGGATVTANGNAVYTIDYANNGTRDASGVVITETLPAGASFDAGNSTAGWLDQGAGIYTFTVGNLTAGGSGSVNFAVTADATFAAGQDILSNSASIAADNVNGTDLDPANNTTSDTTPVIAVPDLNISNDDAGITVLPNGTVVYTLNYANSGLQGASGVVITETVPPGSSFDAANSTPGWSETAPGSGVFTFAVGIVPAGGSGSVDFAVAADATFIAGQDELANTASITDDGSNGADPDLLNNNAVDDTPIDAAPDYRVIKSSDNGNAYLVPGQLVTYTITVLNDGAQDGTGVVVSDSWQSSVFEDPIAISNGGSYNGGSGEITWNVGSMAVGSSVDLTVTAMVRSTLTAGINTVTNSAAATDDLSNGVDPTPVNNTGSDTDSIDAALPDYRIIKSSNNTGPLSAGQIVTYTLEVFNDGNQDGTGIVVRDNFPLGVFTSPSTISNGGTFDPASGEIVWNFADLAAGDSLTLSVTATLAAVVPAGFDEVANTASVSDDGSNGPDIVDNNTATDTDVVDAAPDYFVTVSNNNNGDLEVGETVTYIVDYGNQGTQDGTNVAVTAVVPSGVFLAPSSIGGGGVYAPATGTITWTVDNLASGESGQFSFGATVNDAVAAGFDDAEVKADIADDGQNGPDLNPANNSDNVIDPVNAAPDYVVDKDDGIDFVPRNVDFNYRINVTNAGTQDGTGVIVTDTFPTDILAIVDADGGMIDQGAGTITWNIDTLAVGEQLQFDVVVQVLSTAVIDNSDQLFSNAVSVTGDNDNGADLNPANNNAVASTQLLSDVGDVNFLLDGSRDPHDALHFSGEYPRDFEYNAYPHWLHGRLVGLETMQVEANLVAARTEVELDSAFGLWNHSFYPNPWNHLRAGNTETQELNADYSHWAEPRLNQAIVNGNAVDRINLDGTMVDFADLEQAPNLPQQEAQLQLFKRAVQHEKAMPPGDSSGTRQFEQAANTLRAASIEELVAAFREGRK